VSGLHFESVLDEMSEGLQVLDFEYRYLYLNRAAARHGRRDRHSLVGRRIVDEYPGIEETEVFENMRRCMVERVPRQMTNRFVYPDGGEASFDLRISPVPEGIVVLSVDISDRVTAEEELRRSREDLETILACMVDGLIVTDLEGRVTRMNPAAETLTGWPSAEALGRPLDDLVRFLDQRSSKPIDAPVERILSEGVSLGLANHTLLVARDETLRPIASSGAPLRGTGGSPRGVVVVLKDMQEHHELMAMLQHAQKMEAVGRLAGGVAHDFNNLLTVISGYSDLALSQVEAEGELESHLSEIADAAGRAASLTRQLLAFSRKQILQPRILSLNSVVEEMEGLLRRLIGEDIDLALRLEPDLGLVEFDPGQIEQIVMNLAVNARDAMPTGGRLIIDTHNVGIDEEHARSHVDARTGPHVVLAVIDDGTGMGADTRSRIFDPFFTTKERGKGTGLGLSTVYGLVQQSGGHIRVHSEVDRGTTFEVYLPLADADFPERRPSEVAETSRPTAGSETILVVEDEESVRRLVRRVLERAGYTVLATGSGDDAILRCREHPGEIHLLLTDLVLPGIGGLELSHEVLALRPELAVVYMSGYTDDALVHQNALAPDTPFIEKPILPQDLLRQIRDHLSRDREQAR
jgi:PAS domain S-box-containing protein